MQKRRTAAARVIPIDAVDEVAFRRRQKLFRKLDPKFDLNNAPELEQRELIKLYLSRFSRIASLIPSALFVRDANEPVGFNAMIGEILSYFKTITFEEYLNLQLQAHFNGASAETRAEVLKELMSDDAAKKINKLSISITALYSIRESINLESFIGYYHEALVISRGTGFDDLEQRKKDAKTLTNLM